MNILKSTTYHFIPLFMMVMVQLAVPIAPLKAKVGKAAGLGWQRPNVDCIFKLGLLKLKWDVSLNN